MTRKLISSGTAWERKYGYSRAVQVDNLVVVAGTTAVDEHGRVVAPGHPRRQAKFIYEKIARALAEAGASLADVVRVRTFVVDIGRHMPSQCVPPRQVRHSGSLGNANH